MLDSYYRSGVVKAAADYGLVKQAVIRHEDDQWVLYDSEGEKVLGRHDTKEEAKEQERAIQASKHS